MKNKLTVLIPCKDEENNIGPCLESVQGIADDILVADSGSSDNTLAIARRFPCRIIQREYINSANFKNWAIPQAACPWVLIVDADERATPQLAKEIRSLLDRGPEFDGYRIHRRNFFLGHEIRHCGWNRDTVLRLFRRDQSRYKEMRVHSEVIVRSGKVGILKEKFLHYTYWNISQIIKKYDRYSTWAARDMRDRGRSAGLPHLILAPLFRFIKHFVIQAGFLDGTRGFMVSWLSAYYVFLKYAKVWAHRRGKRPPWQEKTSADSPGGRK